MAASDSIPLAEIAADLRGPRFRAELRTSWAIAVLYRLPAVPAVWAAARLGLSPTQVTYLALLLALTMPLQALFLPLGLASVCVALSGIVFQILDCVDGTLARITRRSSRRGADLDFLTDMAQWALLYLAIGLLADRTLGGSWGWAALAAGAAWVRLYARVIRDRLAEPEQAPPAPVPIRAAQWPVVFVTGLSGLIPFLALAGGGLWLAVLFLLAYAVLDLLDAALPLFAADRA